jgi:hypothetical protein
MALKRSCYDHAREVQAERMAYLLRQRWLAIRPPSYAQEPCAEATEAEQHARERYATFLGPLDPGR